MATPTTYVPLEPMPSDVRESLVGWVPPVGEWEASCSASGWRGRELLPAAFSDWLDGLFGAASGPEVVLECHTWALPGGWEVGVTARWHSSIVGTWEAVAPTLLEAMERLHGEVR